ncbi:BC85_0335 family putative methyltransferase [Mycoplasma corogypsi]|uniref:BC85_0335 family putative methyltransferase n=1 Tax=Mycoplasma corogypsi TaxID=2106 RepID=UPI003872D4D6
MLKGWQIGLVASAIVFMILAFGFYIGVHIWARYYRRKTKGQLDRETLIKMDSLKNQTGELPMNLYKYFCSQANLFDIEGIINTVFNNGYKGVLVINNSDLFPLSAIAQKIKSNVFYKMVDFDYDLFQNAKEKFPEEFKDNIFEYSNQKVDLVYIAHAGSSILDEFNLSFEHLSENGMIIVSYQDTLNADMKSFVQYLIDKSIRHEIDFFGTKLIFITKKPL